MKNNSNTIEITVHTSCYWGLRLTLCYPACKLSKIWINHKKTQKQSVLLAGR